MSIEPKELVEYAHGMLQPEGREVEHRNVVNRAYYGAFLAARDLANITGGSGSVHLKVIEYYRDKKSVIGNNLDDLKASWMRSSTFKTNSPLSVNADAVLALPVTG